MCYGLNCVPPVFMLKLSPPSTSEWDGYLETLWIRCDEVKMRPLGWTLIQSDWCPYEKRKSGHLKRHQVWECTEERPCEDPGRRRLSVSQGEAPETTKPAHTLIFNPQPPELWEHKYLWLKPPSLWYFVKYSRSQLTQYVCTDIYTHRHTRKGCLSIHTHTYLRDYLRSSI